MAFDVPHRVSTARRSAYRFLVTRQMRAGCSMPARWYAAALTPLLCAGAAAMPHLGVGVAVAAATHWAGSSCCLRC